MATAPIRSDWVGRVVDGRFTLLQWLGSSGRSDVFLTELQGPRPRKATIKLIPAGTGDAHARIAGWAATRGLSDPHLMRLFDTGRCQIDTSVLLYAVTEYAEEVLAEIIPERPLTPSEAQEMLGPILDALSYLHGKGFVHGRLKPSNILDVDNQVKLSGDSLQVAGKPVRHAATLTVYDAPEVADGTISPAADIWSLGVTLVETLTQRPPVWERSANREPVVPGSIPQPFADIAQECLRLDPARRCTLSEVKARLGPVLAARTRPANRKAEAGDRNRNATCQTARRGTHRGSARAVRGNRRSAFAISPASAIAASRKTASCARARRATSPISSPENSNLQRSACKGCSRSASSAQRSTDREYDHQGYGRGQDTPHGRSRRQCFECDF